MSEFLKLFKQPLLLIAGGFLFILILIPVLTYIFFAATVKDKASIVNNNNGGVVLLDRNGKQFFTFYQPKETTYIALSDIPQSIQQAAISSEDKEFYQHGGFSFRGIMRAVFTDIERKNTVYGGSTITQQLVKNTLLSQQKTFLRKYQEIILAIELERRFNKQDILEMYLNSVYFGEGAFGVENAAQTYFGKDAKDLTLGESALLVGLLPSPSTLSPISNSTDGAIRYQHLVLDEMLHDGDITQSQITQAEQQPLAFKPKAEAQHITAPHFALYVKNQLIKKYGEEYITRSGFKVRTTIDLANQAYAEKIVANQVTRLQYDKVSNGAAVVIDPKTGEILAYVGSHNWNDENNGKIDMANTARQPGSSFKPIIYATALDKRLITDATVLHDVPTTFSGNYKPLDFDKRFRGDVLVRRALANSLNIPAVEVMQKVGVPDGITMAQKLGITTLDPNHDYGYPLVLGAGEVKLLDLTDVYATFANQGMRNDPAAILEIQDKNGKDIFTYNPQPQQVLESSTAFLISSMLSDNTARAEEFGGALTLSRQAAVKTGTAENFTNALTLGYTPSLTVGVWVGNNDNSPMDNIAGSLGAAPIWRQLMEHYLAGTPVEKFQQPSDVNSLLICAAKGLKESAATSSAYTEYFLSGTEPKDDCNDVSPTSLTPTQTPTLTPAPSAQPTNTPVTPTPLSTVTPLQSVSPSPIVTPLITLP